MSEIAAQIGFRLVDMSAPNFELFGELPEDVNDISIHAKLGWAGIAVVHCLVTDLKIEYRSAQQLWALLEVQCQYEIEFHAWQLIMAGDASNPRFPRPFLEQLAAITIGSARGILFEKTKQFGGTPYLLPLLFPSKLLAEQISWEWR
jgi:hypothetical protein